MTRINYKSWNGLSVEGELSKYEPCCPYCYSSRLVEPEQRVIDGEYYYLTTRAMKPDSSPRSILSHDSQDLRWCEGCGSVFEQRETVELRTLAPVEPPPFLGEPYRGVAFLGPNQRVRITKGE